MTDVVTGAGPDVDAVRLERLARLQAAMRAPSAMPVPVLDGAP